MHILVWGLTIPLSKWDVNPFQRILKFAWVQSQGMCSSPHSSFIITSSSLVMLITGESLSGRSHGLWEINNLSLFFPSTPWSWFKLIETTLIFPFLKSCYPLHPFLNTDLDPKKHSFTILFIYLFFRWCWLFHKSNWGQDGPGTLLYLVPLVLCLITLNYYTF